MQTWGSQKSHSEISESMLHIHERDLLLNTYDTCRLTNYNETGNLLIHWLPTRVWQSTLFATRWNLFFFFFFSQIQNMSPIDLPLHEISSLLQLFAQYGLFPSLLIRSYSLISFWRTLFTFISNLYFPVLSEEYTCLTQSKFTDVTIHSLGVYLNLIRWEKAALLILVF